MAIEISAEDVTNAEAFLETLLTENISEGRFTQGTALRDLVVKAFSFIFAHISKENTEVRSLQSLLHVQNIAVADPDTDRAVSAGIDAILSNWFVTRKLGSFSRGLLTIVVSRRQDYILPGNNRFKYNRTLAFYPDVVDPAQSIVIRAADLLPAVSTVGDVIGYTFQQRVVAARTGVAYDVPPATWEGGRQFSSFVTNIFSTSTFSGGKGKETTTELMDRASTAIAVRNLINGRSISAVLQERFNDIRRMYVTGMGSAEMQRDRTLNIASSVELHLGGHYDIFLELPRTVVTFEGQIGGSFTRPDGVPNVFRDTTVTDWTTEAIQVGDSLRVTAGLPDVPRDYIIKSILATELRISEVTPFSAASDATGTFVDYYIFRPVFGPDVQILPTIGVNTTGETSAVVQTANRIVLPGGAHYEILDVAVIDPDPGDPNVDLGTGYVHFPIRTNETPNFVVSAEYLEYQVLNNEPTTAQSQIQFEELIVESTYEGKTLRVKYETLVSLDTIHNYTRDRVERILAANVLARGYIPVYLSFHIPFKLKPMATATVDRDALRNSLAKYINDFDPRDVIDVSDISKHVRDFDVNIGTVFGFTITYYLIVPDGRRIGYSTVDIVDLDPTKILAASTPVSLDNPLRLSVSDNTVRYMTTSDHITFEDRT